MRYINNKQIKLIAIFITAILLSGIGGYDYGFVKAAPISSNNSAVQSQYTCEQGINYVITEDNAVTPEFYAISTQSTTTVPCGTLVYGGSTNNGGATGTNATQVIQAALNSLPTTPSLGGGELFFEAGNYTVRTLTIPNAPHENIILDGSGSLTALITYIGSNTKQVIWEPYAFMNGFINHLSVTLENLDINIKSATYTGIAVDMTAVPELNILNVNILGQGAVGNAGSIGFKHDLNGGDGNAKELTNLHIYGFSTDMQWNDDHGIFTGDQFEYYLKVGVRFGNNSGITIVDNTMINPHFENNNVNLLTHTGIPIQFNYTSATHGIQLILINPYFEIPILPFCELDFRAVGGSQVIIQNPLDATVSPNQYPRTCLPVNKDMSKVQFQLFQAPAKANFPYFLVGDYFGIDSSLIICTGCSASNNPTSGTAYQDWMVPEYITISGGVGVNITINTPANANIPALKNIATLGTTQPFLLPVGYKLIVTYSSVPITVCTPTAG